MKFQGSYEGKNKFKIAIWFLIFSLIVGLLLYFFRINKFIYTGDLQFVDQRILKISSLNLLKDQPIFWFQKNQFERQLKNDMPQVKEIKYKIIGSDTLNIEVLAEDICCVIKDKKERNYVVATDGKVLREYFGNYSNSIKFVSVLELNDSAILPNNLISILQQISSSGIKIDDVKENEIFIDSNLIFFYTPDSKQVLLSDNTDYKKLNSNLKSMKSYLEQNQKNYSILDFRFEKIVV